MNPLRFISKGFNIVYRRIRDQGVLITLVWLYGRGLPKLTGVPLMQFSEITPQIYVGPQYGKLGKQVIMRQGIRYNVNLRIEFDDAAHGLALENYCHLPTIDDDAPSIEHLQQGVAFIGDAVTHDGKVYIHCAGGVGRAPTLAAAYFISQGMSLDDALNLIKKHRPFIYVMPVQMEQLRQFAKMPVS